MEPTKIETLTAWAAGTLVSGDPSRLAEVICTNSRALQPGELFLALRGENFDGHTFISEAAESGALGVIAAEFPAGLPVDFVVIKVADTLRALQSIAAEYRRSLGLKVIAITGSNGKTSTKDLTAAVLSERFRVTKTAGNFNNHIGLPLTMLRAKKSDEIGIFEIGMNHPGEIAPLAKMAAPDVAIITNIGVAHIEYMGSREAIAQEKGMLAEALPSDGTLILNGEDEFSNRIAARTKAHAIFCGTDSGGVRASDIQQDFGGTRFRLHADQPSVEAELPVPGRHMVSNALLAVGAGRAFGLSLEECAAGLRKLELTRGRLEQKSARGIQILDDSYNANPDSMTAALQTLAEMPVAGRRIAVLGRMGELGSESGNSHRLVGEVAAKLRIDTLIAVGPEAALVADAALLGGVLHVEKFDAIDEAIIALRRFAKSGDVVLVKGSRSARMERIVEGLQTP